MKRFLAIILFALFLQTFQSPANNKVLIQHINKELTKASSPKDSIRLLYDLLDLSQRKDQLEIGNMLFELGSRTKNKNVQFDILRQMANITHNDSILSILESRAKNIRPSNEQKETLLFIHLKQAISQARYLPENQRQKKIAEIIAKNDFDRLDKYGKIERLFTICEYMSNYADGNLMIKYMGDLEKLMDETKLNNYALKNLFYSESANIYTYCNEGKKALEADRKLLNIISTLEKEYKSKGRRYRNYNVNKYIILRRMLSNYKWLSTEDINKIYSQILTLVEKDPDVKNSFWKKRRASAYHAMGNGRYAEAIPYIENYLGLEESMPIRKQLCEMLIEAAKKTGDTSTLNRAKKLYSGIKQEYDSLHRRTQYNELEIRYQVNILKTDKARMTLEKRDADITSARRIMSFVIVGWVTFGIILILMLILWMRYRRNTIEIAKFVNALSEERNILKSKRAGKNVTDYSSTSSLIKKRQRHSVDEMINFILNDLLYISAVRQDRHTQYMEEFKIGEFMNERISTIKALLKKDINLEVEFPEPDFNIFTDKSCLTKLTDHILHLAVRLTPIGKKCGLKCALDDSGKNAKLIFWHSGSPLPDGEEELIFDNFLTFKSMTEEKDAALHMCRMIHILLESSMDIDKIDNNIVTLTITIPLMHCDNSSE